MAISGSERSSNAGARDGELFASASAERLLCADISSSAAAHANVVGAVLGAGSALEADSVAPSLSLSLSGSLSRLASSAKVQVKCSSSKPASSSSSSFSSSSSLRSVCHDRQHTRPEFVHRPGEEVESDEEEAAAEEAEQND